MLPVPSPPIVLLSGIRVKLSAVLQRKEEKRIPELLSSLSECDYSIGIITSKAKAEFKDDFDRFGLNHYFKTIICADDTTEHKPSPKPLLKYIETS